MPLLSVKDTQALVDRCDRKIVKYGGKRWTKSNQPINSNGDISWFTDDVAFTVNRNGSFIVLARSYMIILKPHEQPKAWYKHGSLTHYSQDMYELAQHRTFIDDKWYYLPTMVVPSAGTFGVYDDIAVIQLFEAPGVAYFTVMNNGVKKEYALPNGCVIRSDSMTPIEPPYHEFPKMPRGKVMADHSMTAEESAIFAGLVANYSNPNRLLPCINYYAYL